MTSILGSLVSRVGILALATFSVAAQIPTLSVNAELRELGSSTRLRVRVAQVSHQLWWQQTTYVTTPSTGRSLPGTYTLTAPSTASVYRGFNIQPVTLDFVGWEVQRDGVLVFPWVTSQRSLRLSILSGDTRVVAIYRERPWWAQWMPRAPWAWW